MAKKFDAKAKAKRQKIVAAVLGVLLLAVLAYEVPSLMKTMNKKPPTATATPAAPSAVPAAPGTVPVTPGTPVSAVPTATSLTDSDPAPTADGGQLVTFDRFAGKDPFVQQDGQPTAKPTAAARKAATPPAPQKTQTATAPKPATSAPSTAKISVNGTRETVTVSKSFPKGDDVFVLVSLTRTTAKIGIAGGSLATGGQTVTLTKGKKLALMNTADGTRYELVLISVS